MEGAFTSLKMRMHSSIFSGFTWMVTTRASIVLFLLLLLLLRLDYILGSYGAEGVAATSHRPKGCTEGRWVSEKLPSTHFGK